MIDLADIQSHVSGHSIIKDVDQLPKGHIRMETGFLYPDGSSVDVFLVNGTPHHPPNKLSDLGQTMVWLLDVQVKPWLSRKRQRFIEDALRIYGVKQEGGALELPVERLDNLVEKVILVGQACVRVADLIYTRRSALHVVFHEEVEEVLADTSLPYEPNKELDGRYGKLVKVDFLVQGSRTRSAVLALSSANSSTAHVQANEIFRRWYDLSIPQRTEQRVTVLDDRFDTYREDDLSRIKDCSDLIALSDRQTFCDLLAA